MTLRIERQKNGTMLKVVKSYRREKDGKPTTTTYCKLGLLEDLAKEHEDPIAWAREEAARLTEMEALKHRRTVELDMDEKLPFDEDLGPGEKQRRNIGFAAFSSLYHMLELDAFWKNRKRDRSVQKAKHVFDVEAVFRLLVYNRLLIPSSKRNAWQERGFFAEDYDFLLSNVYEALDFFHGYKEDFTKYMDRQVTGKVGRDTCLMLYDVTNFYFEIDEADEDELDLSGNVVREGMRRYGKNKENRPLPQVQMGLFMDRNGIPISYETFRGNMHDSQTLIPVMKRLDAHLARDKVIIVADKGMMGGDNISRILSMKQGYIISKSVRKADAKFKEWVKDLSTYDMYCDDETGEVELMVKERYVPRRIRFSVKDRKTGEATGAHRSQVINERQVVIWSRKYAQRERRQRDKVIARAEEELVDTTSRFAELLHFGKRKYIRKTPRDKDGKVIIPNDYVLEIDEDRIDEEEALDGFYFISTNVVGFDSGDESYRKADPVSWKYFFEHSDRDCLFKDDNYLVVNRAGGVDEMAILEMYRELWRIEQTFRVTKSDLKARPVHVSLDSHISAHFLICFTALVLMRTLQYKLGHRYSAAVIQDELRRACGFLFGENMFCFSHRSRILDEIGAATGIDFTRKYMTRQQVASLLAQTKKNY